MSDSVILSVRLMTYNHSDTIIECLESIDRQQTNFDFEVIIGDDFSTDNNRQLILDFIAKTNNSKINYVMLDRPVDGEYHIKRKKLGRLYNFMNIIENCSGKYIALFDGDDYWTDSLKLQKQVDFLEANQDFNLCFTRANTLKNNKLELQHIPDLPEDGVLTTEDVLKHYNYVTTSSIVYRNCKPLPVWFHDLPFGDLGLCILITKDSKIKCLQDNTTVYRLHDGGIWALSNKEKQYLNILEFYTKVYHILSPNQKNIIQNKVSSIISSISYQKHKKNRLLRIFNRINLRYKYRLK